jgi:TPR repeat protein
MSEPSWFNQLHHEWHALQRHDAALDVEKFYRHVMSAYKSGFASFEAIATTANALLLSTIPGAPYLGRKLFERVGVNKHPSLRVAYALSLFAGTGGDTDPTTGNIILADVLKDGNAQDALKGLAAAALGDSARLGRGGDTDLEQAKAYYEIAFKYGNLDAARTLGLYWDNCWNAAAAGDSLPDRTRAASWYKRCESKGRAPVRLEGSSN